MQLGFDFDSSSRFYNHIFCFASSKEKYVKENTQVVQILSRLPAYTY